MYRIDTVLGHLHRLEERALLETCWPDAFQPRGCLEGNSPVVWVLVGPNSQRPTVASLFESLAPAVLKRQLVAHPMDPMRKGMRGTGGTTMHGLPAEGEPGSSGGKLSLPRGWNRCHADLQKQMSRKHQVHQGVHVLSKS